MVDKSPITLRPINELNDIDVDRLAAILNEDEALRKWLGMENTPALTPEEIKWTAEEWPENNHAQTFTIYTQELIGSISLSHISPDGTACIGYWITSRAWNQGIGTAAFALIIDKARELGIHQVSAKIQAENTASLRMWQKWGAEQEMLPEDRVRVTLII